MKKVKKEKKAKFFEKFLNNVGPFSKTFEEEAAYRRGVADILELFGYDDFLKEITLLEIKADERGPRSHERSPIQNAAVVKQIVFGK